MKVFLKIRIPPEEFSPNALEKKYFLVKKIVRPILFKLHLTQETRLKGSVVVQY